MAVINSENWQQHAKINIFLTLFITFHTKAYANIL